MRIKELEMLETQFSPREYTPKTVVQPNFQDKNIVTVTARVRGEAAERLEELFGEDIVEETHGEWKLVHISISNDERGYRFLLSFGTDCLLLAPAHIRDEIENYLEDIIQMYKVDLR